MYEKTVGDSNPERWLARIPHRPSPYDQYTIRRHIELYEIHIRKLKSPKVRRKIKADITRMRAWLKQHFPNKPKGCTGLLK